MANYYEPAPWFAPPQKGGMDDDYYQSCEGVDQNSDPDAYDREDKDYWKQEFRDCGSFVDQGGWVFESEVIEERRPYMEPQIRDRVIRSSSPNMASPRTKKVYFPPAYVSSDRMDEVDEDEPTEEMESQNSREPERGHYHAEEEGEYREADAVDEFVASFHPSADISEDRWYQGEPEELDEAAGEEPETRKHQMHDCFDVRSKWSGEKCELGRVEAGSVRDRYEPSSGWSGLGDMDATEPAWFGEADKSEVDDCAFDTNEVDSSEEAVRQIVERPGGELQSDEDPRARLNKDAGKKPRVVRARLAPLGARVMSWALDGSIVFGVTLTMVWLATLAAGAGLGISAIVTDFSLTLLTALFAAFVGAVYSTLFVGLYGQTPGGRVFAVRILDGSGSAPDFTRAAVRGFYSALCVLPFGIGLVWSVLDERSQSLHDRFAGTFAVRAE